MSKMTLHFVWRHLSKKTNSVFEKGIPKIIIKLVAIPVVVAVKFDLAAGKVVASLNGNIPIGLSPGIVAYLAVVFEGAPLPKSVSRAQQCQSVSFD